jgi:hypothetical protein
VSVVRRERSEPKRGWASAMGRTGRVFGRRAGKGGKHVGSGVVDHLLGHVVFAGPGRSGANRFDKEELVQRRQRKTWFEWRVKKSEVVTFEGGETTSEGASNDP